MSKNGRELPSRERGPPFYVAVNHVAVNHVNPVRLISTFYQIQGMHRLSNIEKTQHIETFDFESRSTILIPRKYDG